MHSEIVIDKDNNDREVWRFYFMDREKILVLDSYKHEQRATKRHAWKATKRYERLDQRNSTIGINDVPMTNAIKQMALTQFCNDIKVQTSLG